MIRWGLKVNKNGCLDCSKTHFDCPRDLMTILSEGRYQFSVREQFNARQVIKAVNDWDGHKHYAAFYSNKMIFSVVRQICKYFSDDNFEIELKEGVNRNKPFEESLFKKGLVPEFTNTNELKEFVEKISIYETLFSLSDRKR